MRIALLLSFLMAAPSALTLSPEMSDTCSVKTGTASARTPGADAASAQAAGIGLAGAGIAGTSLVAVSPAGAGLAGADQQGADTKVNADEKRKKPSLSLRASPPISFSPANIHLVAELKGGPDDYEDFYCPAVEWDWGDGTRSEASNDCEPYEAGVSEITRRFSKTHVYNLMGRYRVQVRLKRNSKLLTSASTNVQVRAGLREGPY